jgi:hypothetical protein
MDVSNGEMVEFGVEIRQRCVSRALLSVVMPGPVVNRQAFATTCFIVNISPGIFGSSVLKVCSFLWCGETVHSRYAMGFLVDDVYRTYTL